MGKRIISERHKPSFKSYIRQNLKTTFAFAERVEFMATLGLLLLSTVIALIGGLSVSQFSEEWQIGLAVGLAIFILVQFGIITPFRMWRKSVWVANIEKGLEELWDSYDKGIGLLSKHIEAMIKQPQLKDDTKERGAFLKQWYEDYKEWKATTSVKIESLYPLEARRFKNLIAYGPTASGGFGKEHDAVRSLLMYQLAKIDAIIIRHQPALLPE